MEGFIVDNIFNKGDYIEGFERMKDGRLKIMRGWVDTCNNYGITVQADDSYHGARGTILETEGAHRCNYVEDWQTSIRRNIPVGTIVKHFKNKLYKVIGYADHADGGRVVIYTALYAPYKTYVRELSEFMSEVDHKKYPDVAQKYRFDIVEED